MADPSIGGVRESEVEVTLADVGLPEDAGHGPAARFIAALTRLIVACGEKGEAHDGAVFLLGSPVSDVMVGRAGDPKTAFPNGNDPISGRVWVLSASLSNANALEVGWTTGGGFEEIVAADLGELPALTLDLRGGVPQLMFFPNGCRDPETMLVVKVSGAPISVDEMKLTLDKFFDDNLRTPMMVLDGHGDRIWDDPSKGVPMSRPEERIERRLLDRLKSVYPEYRARAELPTEEGYIDIALEAKDRALGGLPVWRCDWVLELKALAEMTASGKKSTADHPAAIAKGLQQAAAYGKREDALAKGLCVYDMRAAKLSDEEVFEPFKEDAATYGVELWRWRLLRSSEEGRKDQFPLKYHAADIGGKSGTGRSGLRP